MLSRRFTWTILLASMTGHARAQNASALLAGTPEAFLSSCRADLDSTRSQLAEWKAAKGPRDPYATLQAFDTAVLTVNDAQARAGLGEQVHPDKPFRDAAQTCEQEAVSLITNITLDPAAYAVLASLKDSKLDPAATYYLRTTLRDYHRAGVDRDQATRDKIRQLQDELIKIGQEFEQNIAADVRKITLDPSQLDGLPDDYKRSHPADASGKVTLTTDNTDYVPFMQYANNDDARKQFYLLYQQRAYPKNIEVLHRLLTKRNELAKLLGYPDWAAYITEDKMVATKQNAADFIDKIATATQEGSRRDYQELLTFKKRTDPNAALINPWEWLYLERGAKIEKFGFDTQSVRPYLEYSRVQQGILDLTSRMYGITYKPVADAKVWHPDVRVYDVYDGQNRIGRIYFDMFPRANKYKHYATFNLTTGKQGGRLAEYVLVCNFPQPVGGEPGLMELVDVITFFHEYGHLLHGIFRGDAKWATGDLEQDFVEAPSQMFEEWARDPATLATFARHYKTNEPIPAALAQKARAADDFDRALVVRQQMFYAALSLNLYNRDPQGLDSTKLSAELRERYTPFHQLEGTHMEAAFDHLNSYSAVYYTYMWSLVIAKDLFTEFKPDRMADPKVAAKYRQTVLAASGTKPAADLVHDFMGRSYSFQAYADWLNGK
jgi:thimet oligopeptidase